MQCPFCRHSDTRVLDSRAADDGAAIRRRRQCQQCDRRFTTVEQVTLAVVKSSGTTEPFSRDKVIAGARKACQGRPVSEADLARLGQQVEEAIRSTGSAEVPSHEVGMAVLPPLRDLDEVAYLRFASVYRSFDSLTDFEAEIALLRHEQDVRRSEHTTSNNASDAPSDDDIAAHRDPHDHDPLDRVDTRSRVPHPDRS